MTKFMFKVELRDAQTKVPKYDCKTCGVGDCHESPECWRDFIGQGLVSNIYEVKSLREAKRLCSADLGIQEELLTPIMVIGNGHKQKVYSRNEYIYIPWSIYDVEEKVKEMLESGLLGQELSENQLYMVLENIKENQDSNVGVTWVTIETEIKAVVAEYEKLNSNNGNGCVV